MGPLILIPRLLKVDFERHTNDKVQFYGHNLYGKIIATK